jgi:hypothetical protein
LRCAHVHDIFGERVFTKTVGVKASSRYRIVRKLGEGGMGEVYPNLDPLRATPDFRHIVRRAEERQREALDAFRAADGPHLLGLPSM